VLELNNLHGIYNFYIQPVKIDDTITINGNGTSLLMIIPKVLDFSSNDSISIDLGLFQPEYAKGIRFNLNAKEDLVCEDRRNIKRCIVPKSHFENKQNGYYNIYHLNHVNKYIKFYEQSPIQVIFQNDDGGKSDEGKSDGGNGDGNSNPKKLVGITVGSVVGGLVLIAAIVIIIIVVKKRKNNSDEISTGKTFLSNSAKVELE